MPVTKLDLAESVRRRLLAYGLPARCLSVSPLYQDGSGASLAVEADALDGHPEHRAGESRTRAASRLLTRAAREEGVRYAHRRVGAHDVSVRF